MGNKIWLKSASEVKVLLFQQVNADDPILYEHDSEFDFTVQQIDIDTDIRHIFIVVYVPPAYRIIKRYPVPPDAGNMPQRVEDLVGSDGKVAAVGFRLTKGHYDVVFQDRGLQQSAEITAAKKVIKELLKIAAETAKVFLNVQKVVKAIRPK